MSFFFARGQKIKPQFTGLQTQTSTNALPIPICYGMNRVAPNIIWQGDFASHKKKQGGKGGGGAVTYTYSASFILGLCWGPIISIVRSWKDQSKQASYTTLGMTLFLGNNPQSPWGYMTTKHPTEALGYPNIAYLAVANYDLEGSNNLPQHSFEYKGLLWNTGKGGTGDDADPALVINDFLTNSVHGIGFDISVFSNLTSTAAATTTGDSTFQTYCRAMGFAISPALIGQAIASETLARWANLCNTALVWTGYSLKFHPYGPTNVTGNGVTYLPDFPIRYSLTDSDFQRADNADPITFNRVDPADASNTLSLVIANRANEYNDLPVPWHDQGLIDQYGRRPGDSIDAKEICDKDMAAVMVTLMGNRKAYIRNTYEFTLGPQYCLIEPMDLLTCTDRLLGQFVVLVTEVNEGDGDDTFSIVAEEYPSSISTVGTTSSQGTTNTPVNTTAAAGAINPPIIFEPPPSLSSTPSLWAAVSGGDGTTYDPNWGGAYVHLSTDNIAFDQIGDIGSPARQGKLTSALATYGGANPDTANTMQLSLLMSNGDLIDTTATAAAAGSTVSYVGGEFLSYEDVTLTGTNTYNAIRLWRGQYGSTISAHAISSQFARLDQNIFKYPLPAAYIGRTLYIKFQSYNIFGSGVQDLAACTTYTFTPSGVAFGGGTGGVPLTPTGVSGSAGTTFAKLTWTANGSNDGVTGYQVWRATGSSQAFGTASVIATVGPTALQYIDSAVTGGQAYTYFLVAINTIGSSTNTAGVNLTPTAVVPPTIVYPYGFAFQKDALSFVASKNMSYFDTPVAWTLPAGLADCQGTIGDSEGATATAPSVQTDFDLQSPVGTSIGTMRFAASSLTATFIKASATSVPLGQPAVIVWPSSSNGITGTIFGSIKGTRP